MFFMKKHILTGTLILLAFVAKAQDEKMVTDRPGFTNHPATTRSKWMQAETGFSRVSEKYFPPYKDQIFQHPFFLAKYGIGNRFEVRLITVFATTREEATNTTTTITGINTVQLGGKLNFLKEKGLRPGISLVAHYRFNRLKFLRPRYDSIDGANFRFAVEHAFSKAFFLGYNFGMEWKTFRFEPAYVYTISPRVFIAENWLLFAEVYGYAWPKRTPQNSIDFGLAYYINDNLKIDASAGFGLTKPAPDNFFAFGASFRFRTSKRAD